MIDPTAAGTVKRPSADLCRPRGREALSAHPPAPVDDTPRGSLEQRTDNTSAPATFSPEAFRDESAPFPGRHRCSKSCSLAVPPLRVLRPAACPGGRTAGPGQLKPGWPDAVAAGLPVHDPAPDTASAGGSTQQGPVAPCAWVCLFTSSPADPDPPQETREPVLATCPKTDGPGARRLPTDRRQARPGPSPAVRGRRTRPPSSPPATSLADAPGIRLRRARVDAVAERDVALVLMHGPATVRDGPPSGPSRPPT